MQAMSQQAKIGTGLVLLNKEVVDKNSLKSGFLPKGIKSDKKAPMCNDLMSPQYRLFNNDD